MNYRHSFHAGAFADAAKHAALVLLIERLKAKDAAFAVLDSHAGAGLYDLRADAAQRTGEFRHGILRLLADPAPPAALRPYLECVRRHNPGIEADGTGLRWYPGSAQLARDLLRPQDRLVLVELHPEEHAELKRRYGRDKQVAVHQGDGFQALKALLPPAERRGLVLIDPPFEAADEFARAVAGLRAAHRRWPTGIYVLWYPIKDPAEIARFHAELTATGIRRMLAAELLVQAPSDPRQLNGSGLIVVNPPWQVDAELGALYESLAARLSRGRGAGAQVRWLLPE